MSSDILQHRPLGLPASFVNSPWFFQFPIGHSKPVIPGVESNEFSRQTDNSIGTSMDLSTSSSASGNFSGKVSGAFASSSQISSSSSEAALDHGNGFSEHFSDVLNCQMRNDDGIGRSYDGNHPSEFVSAGSAILEMSRVFERFDENNDGLICAKDLHKFMRRLGLEMSEEEALAIVKSVDHNDDGKVDFEEFLSLYESVSDEGVTNTEMDETEDDDQTLLEAFRIFDKNDDGFISAKELQTVLLDLGLSEGKSLRSCERMIAKVDSDGNGEIDVTEFKQMMRSECFQL